MTTETPAMVNARGARAAREGLRGLRVLVVEDSLLVAEVVAQTLADCGCSVVGPVARLHRALPIAREEPLDGAVLDVNLAGECCFPIAEALDARDVPFIFLTGYGDLHMMSPGLQKRPVVRKPFSPADLTEVMREHFRKSEQ